MALFARNRPATRMLASHRFAAINLPPGGRWRVNRHRPRAASPRRPARDGAGAAVPPHRRGLDMNPISTSTLGMSAAFSTTKPACRSGFGSIGRSWSRLPTRLRAIRTEPTRVSCRTRLARMRATSGEVSEVRPAETVGAVLAPRQRRGLRVGGGIGKSIDAGATHRMVRQRIGMHGDEQRRAVRLRPSTLVVQWDERVARAGQRDPVAARPPRVGASVRALWPAPPASHRCRKCRSRQDPCRRDRGPASPAARRTRRELRRVPRRLIAWKRAPWRPAPCAAGGQQESADDARPGPEAAKQQAARERTMKPWGASNISDAELHVAH